MRVDEQDVMEAARRLHGLERLNQIKYVVLEVSGGISSSRTSRDSRSHSTWRLHLGVRIASCEKVVPVGIKIAPSFVYEAWTAAAAST